MVIFGSFSEEEITSRLRKKALGSVNKISEQVNCANRPLDPEKTSRCMQFRAERVGNIDETCCLPANLESSEDNESFDISCLSSFRNGIEGLDRQNLPLVSSSSSSAEDSPVQWTLSMKSPENGCSFNRSTNGFACDSAECVPVMENELFDASHVGKYLACGLINKGNLCFLNATVQALMCCSPFVKLLQELRFHNLPKAGFPTIAAFTELLSCFCVPYLQNVSHGRNTIKIGRPFTPTMFEDILKKFTPEISSSIFQRPRQEDAQEFLSFAMDQMHNELLNFEGISSNHDGHSPFLVSSIDEDGWETVGPRNKSAVTRAQSFVPSKLSKLFGGQLRSLVKARGNKATATIQPFLLLHLDIYPDIVHNIEHALHLFAAPENLEGYRSSLDRKDSVVTARKSVKIQALPKIMIFHLMRFSYGIQGSKKLHKPVSFPLELLIARDLLSSSLEGRRYELVATVTHHGRDPSKGHYTADGRYADGRWLRFDDASVTPISSDMVLHGQAYLLFYKQVH